MESDEKQQLFAQKVQQQNTTLTSQLELYKKRVRVLENIKEDNNYLNEFLEADKRAKHFSQQAQSQFIRDQDIIQDLKQQRDKLDLAVIDYKRQKEECQKTQTIFNQTQRDKEEKYLNDILQLQAKNKDLENVVCKMGKSTRKHCRLLTMRAKSFYRDNLQSGFWDIYGPLCYFHKLMLNSKLYRAYELCDKNEQLHVFDSEDTLEDAEKSRLKMNEFQNDEKVQELKIKLIDYEKLNKLYDDFVPQKELSAKQTYFSSSFISSEKVSSKTKPSMASMPSANLMLMDLNEMKNGVTDENERISKESKDVSNESQTTDKVCNDAFEVIQELSKTIVELEKDLSKFEAKSITFEIALQHKSRENNSLKTLQKENENFMASLQIENAHLKLTYKDLFDSVQRSRVETNHFDEVKVNVNFVEIETKNIELEYQVNVNFLERQLVRKVDDSKVEKD
ncbi:hypothetical protein Tco_1108660 [Tanacetum coccineum]